MAFRGSGYRVKESNLNNFNPPTEVEIIESRQRIAGGPRVCADPLDILPSQCGGRSTVRQSERTLSEVSTSLVASANSRLAQTNDDTTTIDTSADADEATPAEGENASSVSSNTIGAGAAGAFREFQAGIDEVVDDEVVDELQEVMGDIQDDLHQRFRPIVHVVTASVTNMTTVVRDSDGMQRVTESAPARRLVGAVQTTAEYAASALPGFTASNPQQLDGTITDSGASGPEQGLDSDPAPLTVPDVDATAQEDDAGPSSPSFPPRPESPADGSAPSSFHAVVGEMQGVMVDIGSSTGAAFRPIAGTLGNTWQLLFSGCSNTRAVVQRGRSRGNSPIHADLNDGTVGGGGGGGDLYAPNSPPIGRPPAGADTLADMQIGTSQPLVAGNV